MFVWTSRMVVWYTLRCSGCLQRLHLNVLQGEGKACTSNTEDLSKSFLQVRLLESDLCSIHYSSVADVKWWCHAGIRGEMSVVWSTGRERGFRWGFISHWCTPHEHTHTHTHIDTSSVSERLKEVLLKLSGVKKSIVKNPYWNSAIQNLF